MKWGVPPNKILKNLNLNLNPHNPNFGPILSALNTVTVAVYFLCNPCHSIINLQSKLICGMDVQEIVVQ